MGTKTKDNLGEGRYFFIYVHFRLVHIQKGVYHMAKREYTQSRKEANQRWNEQHKEQLKHYRYKSMSKNFVKTKADHDELLELKKLIEDVLSGK